MNTREVLTLQFGHYSNFIGTHWWNLQEQGFEYNPEASSEINHDVLFREGLTNKREVTFTPRVLVTDLRGSLKSLPALGTLYETPDDPSKLDIEWENPTQIESQEKFPKNAFQEEIEKPSCSHPKNLKLENDVKVWSDYLYTRFHPRSVNVIKEYEHENKTSPFNTYPMGDALWNSEAFQEDYCDKIRNYIEECDHFQGFQILLDATDGFSGLTTSCIQYLRDEYDTKSVFAMPIIPSFYHDNFENDTFKPFIEDSLRVLNLGFCFNSLSEHSSLFTPLCTGINGFRQPGPQRNFNHLTYNDQLWYHSSAILASAIDTFTLNYRLKNVAYSLRDLSADVTPNGRNAVAASLCLPFSLNQGADLMDCLDNWDGPLTQSITPRCEIGTSRVMQLITLRGVSEDRLKRPLTDPRHQRDMPAFRCRNIVEMMNMYYAYTCHASATRVTSISKGLSVGCPFPSIFNDEVGFNGNIMATARPEGMDVETTPVLAGLHSGEGTGHMIENLHTEMKKIRFNKFHQFTGIEMDEYNECLDKLFDFRECYEDKYLI